MMSTNFLYRSKNETFNHIVEESFISYGLDFISYVMKAIACKQMSVWVCVDSKQAPMHTQTLVLSAKASTVIGITKISAQSRQRISSTEVKMRLF